MLAIDGTELQRRFYALAREHHPDFHQAAPPEERARVEETSALVNAAYRTLRDPIARVDYLVRLEEGREAREGVSSGSGGLCPASEGAAGEAKAPPALLQQLVEVQEARASSALTWALPIASPPTWTGRRDAPASSRTPRAAGSCRRWWRSPPTASSWVRPRAASSRAAPPTPSIRSSG